jgi:hypothetical protein
MLSSKPIANGHQNQLDQNGYCRCSMGDPYEDTLQLLPSLFLPLRWRQRRSERIVFPEVRMTGHRLPMVDGPPRKPLPTTHAGSHPYRNALCACRRDGARTWSGHGFLYARTRSPGWPVRPRHRCRFSARWSPAYAAALAGRPGYSTTSMPAWFRRRRWPSATLKELFGGDGAVVGQRGRQRAQAPCDTTDRLELGEVGSRAGIIPRPNSPLLRQGHFPSVPFCRTSGPSFPCRFDPSFLRASFPCRLHPSHRASCPCPDDRVPS